MWTTPKKACLLVNCLVYISLIVGATGSITNLEYYETLHSSDFRLRSKRSASGMTDEKHVQFQSLGKEFSLHLRKKTGLLSRDFRVVVVDAHNNEREVDIETSLYHGFDSNDPTSYVQAYWEDEDMVANIETERETFVIEPSWRQLPASANHSMIAYRKSDVHMDDDVGKSYCGFVRPDQEDDSADKEKDLKDADTTKEDEMDGRRKRQAFTPTRNSCPVLLVADYRFFENMGQGSLSKTTSYLIGLIDRVDKLYRQTDFGNGYINMGFEIKEMRIHEAPTVVAGGKDHYNDERDTWDTKPLLERFSADSRFKTVCLAHLFTFLPFDGGVLGLAYIASPRTHSVGGVCSPFLDESILENLYWAPFLDLIRKAYFKDGDQLFLNTGWSSSLNRFDRRLLTSEADLVTTHEFGHNWGSEHDPDTSECSPGSFSGGKHVMYTYSVSGFESNNRIFSPCSRRSMGAVLDSKSYNCFTEPQAAFCGNSNVEEGEECDAGPATKKGTHPCCNKYCMLQPQAKCSDTNDVCCSSCQYTAASVMCYEDGQCETSSYCTGTSKDCPAPDPKTNGTTCFDKGKCQNGVCQSFCESELKESCICDNVTESCQWCCRDNSTSECRPYGGDNLPDGMPCLQGYCNTEGVCEKQVQDLVERFWDVIVNLNPSGLVAFMRANIVGTVIVLSLLVWIPASCAIHHVDRKHQKEDEAHRDWLRANNAALILSSDKDKIRPSLNMRRGFTSNIVRTPYKPSSYTPYKSASSTYM